MRFSNGIHEKPYRWVEKRKYIQNSLGRHHSTAKHPETWVAGEKRAEDHQKVRHKQPKPQERAAAM